MVPAPGSTYAQVVKLTSRRNEIKKQKCNELGPSLQVQAKGVCLSPVRIQSIPEVVAKNKDSHNIKVGSRKILDPSSYQPTSCQNRFAILAEIESDTAKHSETGDSTEANKDMCIPRVNKTTSPDQNTSKEVTMTTMEIILALVQMAM